MALLRKKSKPVPPSLIIGLCLLSVAALCFIISAVIPPNQPSTKQLLDTVQRRITKEDEALAVVSSEWNAQVGSQLPLAAEGFNFRVSTQAFPSIYVTVRLIPYIGNGPEPDVSSPKNAEPIIDSAMREAKFTKKTDHSYVHDDTTCVTLYDDMQSVLTLSCYDETDIQGFAKMLKPYVDAYNSAHITSPIISNDIVGPTTVKSHYGAGVIGSSHAAGYDIAEAIITKNETKKIVLFYRKLDNAWQFVSEANDEYGFACTDYTADADKRTAFYDQICLGDSGQVRLDTNGRALQ